MADSHSDSDLSTTNLALGRDAVNRHAWDQGTDALRAADREQALSPDDLELLGTAAWWAARLEESTDALERAFAAFEEAAVELDEAMAIARRGGSADGLYVAMAMKGTAEVMSGKPQAGLAELDEAATAASSGHLDLRSASDIFCMMIGACRNVGDLLRAGQWADESERWMTRNGAGGYPGICRVHRAELKMLRGDWPAAELEARTACDELERFRLLDGVGFAWTAIGEVRLRMGDLEGAQDAFD